MAEKSAIKTSGSAKKKTSSPLEEKNKAKNTASLNKEATSTKKKASSKQKPSKAETTRVTSITEKKIPKTKTEPVKKKKNAETPLPFEINSYVFYPNDGLGKIIGLEKIKYEDEVTPYYVIDFKSQKMIVKVPVKNVKKLRIRKILSKASAQKVLKSLDSTITETDLSWKDRLLKHQEVLKKGSTMETAMMITSLHARSKERQLSFQERQYYDFAFGALSDELAVSLNRDREEIIRTIKQILNDSYVKSIQDASEPASE